MSAFDEAAFLAGLPEYTAGMVVRCPTKNRDGTPIDEDDVPGCGSEFVSWDGELYDCHECGCFFEPSAADPPHLRPREKR